MRLTKRQWIMFVLFMIELAFVLFTSAISRNLLIISSSLSTLLFLGALYLEHSVHSPRILLLAGIWLIVNGILSLFSVFPVLIQSFSVIILIELVIRIALYVGIYIFSMRYYQNDFYSKKDRLLITALAAPTIAVGMYYSIQFLLQTQSINLLSNMYILMGFIVSMIVPISIITYTWLRHFRIE